MTQHLSSQTLEVSTETKTSSHNLSIVKMLTRSQPWRILNVAPYARAVEVRRRRGEYVWLNFNDRDFSKAYDLITNEIKSRDNPEFRIAPWECIGEDGEHCPDIFEKKLKFRKMYF